MKNGLTGIMGPNGAGKSTTLNIPTLSMAISGSGGIDTRFMLNSDDIIRCVSDYVDPMNEVYRDNGETAVSIFLIRPSSSMPVALPLWRYGRPCSDRSVGPSFSNGSSDIMQDDRPRGSSAGSHFDGSDVHSVCDRAVHRNGFPIY